MVPVQRRLRGAWHSGEAVLVRVRTVPGAVLKRGRTIVEGCMALRGAVRWERTIPAQRMVRRGSWLRGAWRFRSAVLVRVQTVPGGEGCLRLRRLSEGAGQAEPEGRMVSGASGGHAWCDASGGGLVQGFRRREADGRLWGVVRRFRRSGWSVGGRRRVVPGVAAVREVSEVVMLGGAGGYRAPRLSVISILCADNSGQGGCGVPGLVIFAALSHGADSDAPKTP